MLYRKKNYWTTSTSCRVKNCEIIQIVFFMSLTKNYNKTFGRQKFKCVWRRPIEASKHTKKLFGGKMFYWIFATFMKNTFFYHLKICYLTICWLSSITFFVTVKYLTMRVTNEFYVFGGATNSKSHKNNQMSSKLLFSWVIWF